MTDYRHLGDFFIVGIDGTELQSAEADLLSKLSPRGIILFAKNFAAEDPCWPERLRKLQDDCREAGGRADLLFSVDHEGGRVHRFPRPVTHFPAARHWAGQARAVGRVMGIELRSLGFDLDFAPVLDVHAEEQNTVIGERAFSTDAAAVAEPALEFLKGLESQGVLGCIKHFPGHGATVADSHFELPELPISADVFRSRELRPFIDFFSKEPSSHTLLMSAHVRYSFLDSEYPATLSKTILVDLLRKELGFEGVVITDDLGMGALLHLEPGARAEACFAAGCDLLLPGYPKEVLPLEEAMQMAAGLDAAHIQGRLSEARLEEARSRITRLSEHLERIQADAEYSTYDIAFVGCEEHQATLSAVPV